MSIQYIDSEAVQGTIDGVNASFSLQYASDPSTSLILILNGETLIQSTVLVPADYSLSGTTITMTTPPAMDLSGAPFVAFYRYNTSSISVGPNDMVGADFKTMFETMVDDSMDDDQFYIFLNAAKNEIETSRDWNFNRAYDDSKTIAVGSTYLTEQALPTDFLAPRRWYLNNDLTPMVNVPFELRDRYRDAYKRYYIDWLNKRFGICGAVGVAGRTIQMYYARATDNITATTAPVWPAAFHPLLGFKVAEMWAAGSDGDELNFRMSRENLRLATNLLKSMIAWDSKIKTIEYNDRNAQNVDLSSYPNVVGSEFLY